MAGTNSALGNHMTGSTASASASYRRPADLNSTSMTASTAGPTTNDHHATGATAADGTGEIKPRSLRFTWSMKTTSSMDPSDMMREIRKVSRSTPPLVRSSFLFACRFSISTIVIMNNERNFSYSVFMAIRTPIRLSHGRWKCANYRVCR